MVSYLSRLVKNIYFVVVFEAKFRNIIKLNTELLIKFNFLFEYLLLLKNRNELVEDSDVDYSYINFLIDTINAEVPNDFVVRKEEVITFLEKNDMRDVRINTARIMTKLLEDHISNINVVNSIDDVFDAIKSSLDSIEKFSLLLNKPIREYSSVKNNTIINLDHTKEVMEEFLISYFNKKL